MRKILPTLTFLAVLVLLGCGPKTGPTKDGNKPPEPAGPGSLTPANTKIEWVGTKKEGKHDGGFKLFSGSVTPVAGDFSAATIKLEIDTDSLYSDTPKLTNHLKQADFFDVKKYPKASFTSTSIQPSQAEGATHKITGDLTLHGTTKPLTFSAKVTQTDAEWGLDSTFTFDRTEYGIAFDPARVDKIVTVKVSAKIPRK
jgi:polyisoprenoid-binding protein YceI